MKISNLILPPLLALTILTIPDLASAKTWGLGAVVGSPTGLSANYFLSESRTIHTTLAYDLSGDDDLELASHYTWRKADDLNFEKFKMGWFYGAGAMLTFRGDHDHSHPNNQVHNHDDDDIDFGPSGTIGIFHEFTEVPLEIFLKGNLTLNLIEDTDVDADAMIGLHYNF